MIFGFAQYDADFISGFFEETISQEHEEQHWGTTIRLLLDGVLKTLQFNVNSNLQEDAIGIRIVLKQRGYPIIFILRS